MNRLHPSISAFFAGLAGSNPYGPPPISTSPKDFHRNGKHLNPRQLRKRMKAHSFHTSPNKSRRARAMKGFRMGRVSK